MSEQAFNTAHDAFVPAADDNPDCVPFYRAAAGLYAAWGKEFCDRYNSAVHRAACECSHSHPTMSRYQLALYMLKYTAEQTKAPSEPRYSYSSRCEPSEPTEQDARNIFNAQFKRAFPGQRLNSKAAKEKWAQVRDKAFSLARADYETALAAYRAHEASIDKQNAARKAEYQGQLDAIQQFRAAVAAITNEGVTA